MNGAVVGATAFETTKMIGGGANTYVRSSVFELGGMHGVTVIHAGNDAVNNLPAGLLIENWIRSLEERLPVLEDYVASFINFLENGDLRMFPLMNGYGNWQQYAMSWFLESKSYELINKFFEESQLLQELGARPSAKPSLEDFKARHDLLLQLVNEEIERLYKENQEYTSFPIALTVEHLKQEIEEGGFESSWGSLLASAFSDQLDFTSLADEETGTGENLEFPLSEEFQESITLLTALVLGTRLDKGIAGAIFTFAGYGLEQSMPRLTSIVVDGVFLRAKYYPVKLEDRATWSGLGYGDDDLPKEPRIEVGAETYPLWVSSPTANYPIVFCTTGPRNVLDGYFNGIQETKRRVFRDKISNFLIQLSGPLDGREYLSWPYGETTRNMLAENLLDDDFVEDREQNFQFMAREMRLADITQIVSSVLRLQSYEGAFNDSEGQVELLGGPLDVLTMDLRNGVRWILRGA